MLTLISSDRFAAHQNPPGHPERVERAEVMEVVASKWSARGGASRRAAHGDDRAADARSYAGIRQPDRGHGRPRRRARSGHVHVGGVARDRAAGRRRRRSTPSNAVRTVKRPRAPSQGVPNRTPCSRWCGRRDTMPNAAGRWVSACSTTSPSPPPTRARDGAARVAIVDYDVHHGNGTQHIFEADPNVLYVSLHQFPFYPGHRRRRRNRLRRRHRFHGQPAARSRGGGRGLSASRSPRSSCPVLQQYKPDLLLVSAGFDAHERDPLAGMRLTTGAFGAMTLGAGEGRARTAARAGSC